MFRINKLIIEKDIGSLLPKSYCFNFRNKTIIFSKQNSVGKTTLVRFILFSMGYRIPSTKQINMMSFETTLFFSNKNGEYCIKRNGYEVSLFCNDVFVSKFNVNVKESRNSLLMFLFETYNPRVVEQVIGCFYIDQENGWEVSNKGKVIQYNTFSTIELLSALFDKDVLKYEAKIEELRNSISHYSALQKLVAPENVINDNASLRSDSIFDATYNELKLQRSDLINRKDTIEKEIKNIKQIIANNNKLIDIIENYNLIVKRGDGDPFVLKKEYLYNYDINENLMSVKINDLQSELNELNKKIAYINGKINELNPYFDVKTVSENAVVYLREANIDSELLVNIIKECKKEIEDTQKIIDSIVLENNETINSLQKHINKRIRDLGHEMLVRDINLVKYSIKNIFSGVILHDICLAYKLGCADFLKEKLNIDIPFIIDSPGNGERKIDNLSSLVNYVVSEYTDKQIIISTASDIDKNIFDWHIECDKYVFEGNYKQF